MLREMRFLFKIISIARPLILKAASLALLAGVLGASHVGALPVLAGQNNEQLTPMQREIERQRQRLKSEVIEERRDALMRLGNLKRPEAASVAASGLSDAAPIVRVTAAHAILSLP